MRNSKVKRFIISAESENALPEGEDNSAYNKRNKNIILPLVFVISLTLCFNKLNKLSEKYLNVFLNDGDVPMDNNASERAIRGFCIGKKNWEMIDTINGATSSAIIYSIAETAKANDLKPYEYFTHLLTELPQHTEDKNRDFLADLLPWSEKLPEYIRKPKGADQK